VTPIASVNSMSAVRLGPVTRVMFVGGSSGKEAKQSSSVAKILSRETIATWGGGKRPAWTPLPPELTQTRLPVSAMAPYTSSTVAVAHASSAARHGRDRGAVFFLS